LILAGIGFLYVGFTWSDLTSLIITCFQAFVFLALAFYGTKRSLFILAVGYMLHGSWDLVYSMYDTPGLVPPGYDIFCSSLDFVVGLYILYYARYSLQRA
jgi:hypothetical protein